MLFSLTSKSACRVPSLIASVSAFRISNVTFSFYLRLFVRTRTRWWRLLNSGHINLTQLVSQLFRKHINIVFVDFVLNCQVLIYENCLFPLINICFRWNGDCNRHQTLSDELIPTSQLSGYKWASDSNFVEFSPLGPQKFTW